MWFVTPLLVVTWHGELNDGVGKAAATDLGAVAIARGGAVSGRGVQFDVVTTITVGMILQGSVLVSFGRGHASTQLDCHDGTSPSHSSARLLSATPSLPETIGSLKQPTGVIADTEQSAAQHNTGGATGQL